MTAPFNVDVDVTVVVFALVLAALLGLSCTPTDSQFSTPAATIETLFSTYGIEKMSEQEVRARLQARERFVLRDAETHRRCFADWMGEQDQGLAGYVFGKLAAAKDHLRIEVDQQTASVRFDIEGAANEPVILDKVDGGWKIALKKSVPEAVRTQLYEVYRRARRQERRAVPRAPN